MPGCCALRRRGRVAEELVAQPDDRYQMRSAERQTNWPPTGTFNFVRIHGDRLPSRPLLVSAKLAPRSKPPFGFPIRSD